MAGHLTLCDCFGICYIFPNQQVFRKYIIFSLFTKWLRGQDLVSWPWFGDPALNHRQGCQMKLLIKSQTMQERGQKKPNLLFQGQKKAKLYLWYCYSFVSKNI